MTKIKRLTQECITLLPMYSADELKDPVDLRGRAREYVAEAEYFETIEPNETESANKHAIAGKLEELATAIEEETSLTFTTEQRTDIASTVLNRVTEDIIEYCRTGDTDSVYNLLEGLYKFPNMSDADLCNYLSDEDLEEYE